MMMSSLTALAVAQASAQPEAPPPPPIVAPRPPVQRAPPAPPPPPPGSPPTPPRQMGGSISNQDYPAAAIRAGEQGIVEIRLTVGPNGRVSGCTVVASSGSSILDSTTCQLITRRFRYQPATRNGAPTLSDVTRRVIWRLPDGPEIMFAQGRFTRTVTISGAVAAECRIEQIGTAFVQFDTGQCRDPGGDRMVALEAMGAGQPATRITHILSLLPDGVASTLPRLPGTPFAEWIARVEVAPDGRVTGCTPVSQQGLPPAYVHFPYRLGCPSLMGRRAFQPVTSESVRRARMGSALYVEVLGARPR